MTICLMLSLTLGEDFLCFPSFSDLHHSTNDTFGQTSMHNLVLLNQRQQGSGETVPCNREQLNIEICRTLWTHSEVLHITCGWWWWQRLWLGEGVRESLCRSWWLGWISYSTTSMTNWHSNIASKIVLKQLHELRGNRCHLQTLCL